MKCVRSLVSGNIRRVSDKTAIELTTHVPGRPVLWCYCPKSEWKEKVRDVGKAPSYPMDDTTYSAMFPIASECKNVKLVVGESKKVKRAILKKRATKQERRAA